MARAAIRFAESALADLESIRDWYADHPDMGRIVPEFDQPFLRELIRPPNNA